MTYNNNYYIIAGNDIGSKGAECIAEVLKTNHTLTTLDISNNIIINYQPTDILI